jgi:hypothetical protein
VQESEAIQRTASHTVVQNVDIVQLAESEKLREFSHKMAESEFIRSKRK